MRTNTHISGRFFYSTSRRASVTHTHTSSCVLKNLFNDDTQILIPIPVPTLDCLRKHIFRLHTYRSVSLARKWRYTHLAYLFHQCATSLLSRDGRIADCTVKHPGVERPFSSSVRHANRGVYLGGTSSLRHCFPHRKLMGISRLNNSENQKLRIKSLKTRGVLIRDIGQIVYDR